MSRISIEIPWEVDNGNGIERTLLDAYTATYNKKGQQVQDRIDDKLLGEK